MPDELRTMCLVQFLLCKKLRGLRFNKPVMPKDALDETDGKVWLCHEDEGG